MKIKITFTASNLFSTSMTSSSMSKSLTTSSFSGGGAKTSSFTGQNKRAVYKAAYKISAYKHENMKLTASSSSSSVLSIKSCRSARNQPDIYAVSTRSPTRLSSLVPIIMILVLGFSFKEPSFTSSSAGLPDGTKESEEGQTTRRRGG